MCLYLIICRVPLPCQPLSLNHHHLYHTATDFRSVAVVSHFRIDSYTHSHTITRTLLLTILPPPTTSPYHSRSLAPALLSLLISLQLLNNMARNPNKNIETHLAHQHEYPDSFRTRSENGRRDSRRAISKVESWQDELPLFRHHHKHPHRLHTANHLRRSGLYSKQCKGFSDGSCCYFPSTTRPSEIRVQDHAPIHCRESRPITDDQLSPTTERPIAVDNAGQRVYTLLAPASADTPIDLSVTASSGPPPVPSYLHRSSAPSDDSDNESVVNTKSPFPRLPQSFA